MTQLRLFVIAPHAHDHVTTVVVWVLPFTQVVRYVHTASTTTEVTNTVKTASTDTAPLINTEHKDRSKFLADCFYDIEKIIDTNLPLHELQNQIETYLFLSQNHYSEMHKDDAPAINLSSPTSKWLMEKRELLREYVKNILVPVDVTPSRRRQTLAERRLEQTREIVAEIGYKVIT